ncbi:MAG: hypothetical protein LBI55_00160 [Oscillospiraceae bacterium]|jgi:hypothetical protein|nr:hypothetical protein [Oscillospiraceae bacterium]
MRKKIKNKRILTRFVALFCAFVCSVAPMANGFNFRTDANAGLFEDGRTEKIKNAMGFNVPIFNINAKQYSFEFTPSSDEVLAGGVVECFGFDDLGDSGRVFYTDRNKISALGGAFILPSSDSGRRTITSIRDLTVKKLGANFYGINPKEEELVDLSESEISSLGFQAEQIITVYGYSNGYYTIKGTDDSVLFIRENSLGPISQNLTGFESPLKSLTEFAAPSRSNDDGQFFQSYENLLREKEDFLEQRKESFKEIFALNQSVKDSKREITGLKKEITGLNKKIALSSNQNAGISGKNDSQIEYLKTQLSSVTNDKNRLEEESNVLKAEALRLKELNEQIELSKSKSIEQAEAHVSSIEQGCEEKRKEYEKIWLKGQDEKNSAVQKAADLEVKIRAYEEKLNEAKQYCTECGQYNANLEQRIKELEENLKVQTELAKSATGKVKQAETSNVPQDSNKIYDALQSKKKKLRKAKKSNEDLQIKLQNMTQQKDDLLQRLSDTDRKLSDADAACVELKRVVGEQNEAIKQLEASDAAQLATQLEAANARLAEMRKTITKAALIYKEAHFIFRNENITIEENNPSTEKLVENVMSFLKAYQTKYADLKRQEENFKQQVNRLRPQLETETQKHINTFLSMSRQCERRIALLKRFYSPGEF